MYNLEAPQTKKKNKSSLNWQSSALIFFFEMQFKIYTCKENQNMVLTDKSDICTCIYIKYKNFFLRHVELCFLSDQVNTNT